MRRVIAFPCAGETLVGTLDAAAGSTGLLIVSGGNEIRAGTHRGMAMLAAKVAAAGHPVLRFDRRGVGDSSGENGGFRSSGPDLAAAVGALCREAGVTRIIGFGNCDGASSLALFGREAGVAGLILANPWLRDPVDDLPPPAAIRARYAARLRDPAAWRRLMTGGASLRMLVRGLGRVATARKTTPGDVVGAIAGWRGTARVILAAGDATALAYADAVKGAPLPTLTLETASHSFADAEDGLAAAVIEGLAKLG